MADDIEDFGDFTSAFQLSTSANDANITQSTATDINQVNSTGKMDFFASFPPTSTSTSGEPSLDFATFDAFPNHTSGAGFDDGEGVSNFGQFDVTNLNLAELKIPSPSHDPNVHMVGGVAFDIPPLLDDAFSDPGSPTALPVDQVQLQNDFLTNFAKSEAGREEKERESTEDVHLSFPNSTREQGGLKDKENTNDDSFGDFELSLSLKTDNGLMKTSTELPSTLGLSLPTVSANDSERQEVGQFLNLGGMKTDEDFGEFGGFTATTGTDSKTESSAFTADFSSFELTTPAVETESEEGKNGPVMEETEGSVSIPPAKSNDFVSFDHFQSSETSNVNQEDSQFGDFGVFSGSSTTNALQGDNEFGSFGNFQTMAASTTAGPESITVTSAQKVPTADEFGAFADSTIQGSDGGFGDFQAQTSSTASSLPAQQLPSTDDFGAFADSMSTGNNSFGDFQAPTNSETATTQFSSTTQVAVPPVDDFGAFADSSNKDDEFGGFSSTSTSGTFPTPTSTQDTARHKKVEDLISNCFPGAGSPQDKQVPQTTAVYLNLQLSPTKSPESLENEPPTMFWSTLQKSVDFTIPLKKWDKSYMQDRYYGALKMDPMLVAKTGVLPLFNGMGQFEAPLGGVTALDLLESFGFEGGLEAMTQEPASPTSGIPFRRRSSGSPGPALLDLSLPSSPRSPTNKDASFTLDADLQGLDLNPLSQSKQLTSIQELVLNERLVVNRSTWMDSELLELGGGGAAGGSGSINVGETSPSSQSSSQPSTPRTGKKQNSIELQLLQLGLDASKTTSFANASSMHNVELSLSARSTLGRLPDLSFMLQRDKLVRSTYQSGQGAAT